MPIKKLFKQLMPFVIVGVVIVIFAFGIMLLAYLLLFGAIVGTILFAFNWIRDKLRKPPVIPTRNKQTRSGRVIDTDDWKHL
jgi:hypothetical protein